MRIVLFVDRVRRVDQIHECFGRIMRSADHVTVERGGPERLEAYLRPCTFDGQADAFQRYSFDIVQLLTRETIILAQGLDFLRLKNVPTKRQGQESLTVGLIIVRLMGKRRWVVRPILQCKQSSAALFEINQSLRWAVISQDKIKVPKRLDSPTFVRDIFTELVIRIRPIGGRVIHFGPCNGQGRRQLYASVASRNLVGVDIINLVGGA
ncbi:hypothetical protein DPH57_05900 [Massilia sp. YMA4]|nr:hypothetical protein DPH57_05900 [Massilia sp. YMA4]